MTKTLQKSTLILSLISIIILPLIGSFIKWGGLPPGFGGLPEKIHNPPPFNIWMFLFLLLIWIGMALHLLFPSRFGFKKPSKGEYTPSTKSQKSAPFPLWFWPGTLLFIANWFFMWGQFEWLGVYKHLTFTPLWWGYILFIDGIVYKRTGGISLISRSPLKMVGLALFSIVGWYYYEYFNYFVLENWYYPYQNIFPKIGSWVLAAVTFSTVWPSIFEWYTLLDTFDFMKRCYAKGPILKPSKNGKIRILITGIIFSFIVSIWPGYLFWTIWVGVLLVLSSTLSLLKIWTPFTPIAKGDWTPLMLIILGALFDYIFGEMWNHWSAPNNPNYWVYDLPYVHKYLIFEMPFLGYAGYFFFGAFCWVLWIIFG